jgi:hypothetical protein
LASILHEFGYVKTAKLIFIKKDDFLYSYENKELFEDSINQDSLYNRKRKKMKKIPEPDEIPKPKMFLGWLQFIQYYLWALKNEHGYITNKINRSFDLFQQMNDMKNDEFVLAALQATDNGRDHAVCISNKFIFDSNYDHAITFSEDALNACCPPGFLFINNGYYFHKRKVHTNIWLRKKNQDQLKSIKNL